MKSLRNKKCAKQIGKQWASTLTKPHEVIFVNISDSPRSFDPEIDSVSIMDFEEGEFKPIKNKNKKYINPSPIRLKDPDSMRSPELVFIKSTYTETLAKDKEEEPVTLTIPENISGILSLGTECNCGSNRGVDPSQRRTP